MKQKELSDVNSDKINDAIVKNGVSLYKLLDEQRHAFEYVINRLDKVNSDLKALRFRLSKYMESMGNKKDYYEFSSLKDKYFLLLNERYELEDTLIILEESIAEGESLHVGGIPIED